MRIIRSFLIIGTGAFAAGIFYSKAGYDHGTDHWLFFGASIVVAVAGLIDLAALRLEEPPPAAMFEVIAWIWIAVTLVLGAAWAAADLAHNRRCGTWDVGRTLSRLPTVLLVAMWWPILFPASCIGRARNRKR